MQRSVPYPIPLASAYLKDVVGKQLNRLRAVFGRIAFTFTFNSDVQYVTVAEHIVCTYGMNSALIKWATSKSCKWLYMSYIYNKVFLQKCGLTNYCYSKNYKHEINKLKLT
jgi:hypothetical protein